MVLYIVGLGLSDEKDITVKGLEAVRSCSRVYLDAYTSILGVDTSRLVRSASVGTLGFIRKDAVDLWWVTDTQPCAGSSCCWVCVCVRACRRSSMARR